MNTDSKLRSEAITILKNYWIYDRDKIIKAIFDVSHHPKHEDVSIMLDLLEHSDCGIVANALYYLFQFYDQKEKLLPLVQQFALGDERDSFEMPIQSQAIFLLSGQANSDPKILSLLTSIAEDPSMSECPRTEAWRALADIHGLEWIRSYSEAMIQDPDSETSEAIRANIRKAMRSKEEKNL